VATDSQKNRIAGSEAAFSSSPTIRLAL